MDHSNQCLHCLIGCSHPHGGEDPLLVEGLLHSGPLRVAADEWHLLRCRYCSVEAKTPAAMLTPVQALLPRYPDGVLMTVCATCKLDIERGRKPGYRGARRWN